MVLRVRKCLSCRGELSIFKEGVYDTRFGVDGHFDIYTCKACSLIHLNPFPSGSELRSLYKTYYNLSGSKKGLYNKLRKAFLESVFYRFWLAVDSDISFHNFKGSGRLLDVGCNEGRGLIIYRQNGFDAEGLEINERAAMEGRRGGLGVYTDCIEDFKPKESYNVVVLANVPEHSYPFQFKAVLGNNP